MALPRGKIERRDLTEADLCRKRHPQGMPSMPLEDNSILQHSVTRLPTERRRMLPLLRTPGAARHRVGGILSERTFNDPPTSAGSSSTSKP